MNFEQAVLQLTALLEHNKFRFHPAFVMELQKLLKTALNGHESDFFRRLIKLLEQLDRNGKDIIRIDGHELLSHSRSTLYSLHVQTKYINLRLIISFIGKTPVFLACFNEKSGKKRTGYQNYIQAAEDRLKDMKEE